MPVVEDGLNGVKEREEQWIEKDGQSGYDKDSKDIHEYIFYELQIFDVKWSEHLDISAETSGVINKVHTELNEFMNIHHREKMYLIDILSNTTPIALEGDQIDGILLTKDVFKTLKTSKDNSIIFFYVHPSSTTFSSADLRLMVDYKSIKVYTLECVNGDKYVLDRGKYKSSFMNKLNFQGNYDKIYNRIAEKYPELDDSVKIYEVWDDFLYEVISDVAKYYGMIFMKVG